MRLFQLTVLTVSRIKINHHLWEEGKTVETVQPEIGSTPKLKLVENEKLSFPQHLHSWYRLGIESRDKRLDDTWTKHKC